jgi:hypothetical protein
VSRRRPVLRWVHFGWLVYGIVIEIAPWPCPLTMLEDWLLSKGGIAPCHEPFLVHYLEATVYPNVPEVVLVPVAVAVCAVNLSLHVRGVFGVGIRFELRPAPQPYRTAINLCGIDPARGDQLRSRSRP